MTLDSVLNVIIPAGIFIFLAIIIYQKAKKPIDGFFKMVAGWFKQKDEDGGSGGEEYSGSDVWEHKIKYRGEE